MAVKSGFIHFITTELTKYLSPLNACFGLLGFPYKHDFDFDLLKLFLGVREPEKSSITLFISDPIFSI